MSVESDQVVQNLAVSDHDYYPGGKKKSPGSNGRNLCSRSSLRP